MLLTDREGLRFQAGLYVAMTMINVPVSAVLARSIGAVGPVLGSVGATIVALWIPGVWKALALAPKEPLQPSGPGTPPPGFGSSSVAT